MEELDYNLLFRWFVALNMDDPVWDATVYCKYRERLLKGQVTKVFFQEVLKLTGELHLLSDEHFTVDGMLIEACSSILKTVDTAKFCFLTHIFPHPARGCIILMMAHDRYFFDPESGQYTVGRFLDDMNNRFGGIDAVLDWATCPNLGVDNRNQFGLVRDLPGGLSGVRAMVEDIHRHGVRVLFPYNPWDLGTRPEDTPDWQTLTQLMGAVGADGLNGDTMYWLPLIFRTTSDAANHPLALQAQILPDTPGEELAWNNFAWNDWIVQTERGWKYPEGWAQKPVTWVSLDDARAYAKWAGKRLPHEWEWQYAAQGTDGRLYPWGSTWEAAAVPPPEKGRTLRPPTDVGTFPRGASPFGVMGLVGTVWQWTDEYQDEHTRAAILRGGSYYQPQGSLWYFPQAYKLNEPTKYLLMAPNIDRSASIGFRCVVDSR